MMTNQGSGVRGREGGRRPMWGRLRSVSGSLQSRVAAWPWIGLLLFAVVIGARELGWLVPWELGALDNFVRLRPPRTLPSPEVMMVWIGEEEILELGHPLPDSVLASAVATLEGLGPSAIGIDVYRDRATGDGWADLRTQFLANSNLVIVEKLADSTHPGVQPPSFLSDRSQVGFSDVTLDGDGVVRRGLLILWDEDGKAFLSFALQLALRHLRVEGITLEADPDQPDFVRLGPTTLLPLTASFGGYKNAAQSDVTKRFRRDAYLTCAWNYLNLPDYENCIVECDKAIDLDEKFAWGYLVRGRAELELNKCCDAETSAEKAFDHANDSDIKIKKWAEILKEESDDCCDS